jgi:hypothetical protein
MEAERSDLFRESVLGRFRLHPIQGCSIHPEGAGYIDNGVAGAQPLDRRAALVRR